MRLGIALLMPALAGAAITNIQLRPSPQQVVVSFSAASSPGSCTLTMSESASMTPVVRDLDTTLFSGSNLASRPGNIITGNRVTFIAGQRGMLNGLASDGNYYSRSLQVDTPYYGQITCGADTATFITHTQPLPAGMTHQDNLPQHWPTIQSEISCVGFAGPCPRNTEQIIDPQTGVLATHVDMGADVGYRETNVQFGYPYGSGWAISGNFLTSNAGTATITGATNPLFVTVNATRVITVNDVMGGGNLLELLISFQAYFNASMNNAACTTGNSNPDCAVAVCVTTNGVGCAANAQLYTVYLTNTPTTYYFGGGCAGTSSCSTLTPYDVMQQPGKRIWNQPEIGLRSGWASCNGTNNVSYYWDGHAIDPDVYTIGSQIIPLDSGGYSPITAIQDALNFTLGRTCADSSGNAGVPNSRPAGVWGIGGSMFGVMVAKGDVGPGGSNTLTIGQPLFNDLGGLATEPQIYAGFLGMPFNPTNAAGHKCGIVSLTGGDYCIDLATGISNTFADNGGSANSNFYDSHGAVWKSSGTTLTQLTYTGDYGFPTDVVGGNTYLPAWQYDHGNTLPTCGGGITTQCWQPTVSITGLDTALAAFDARYSSTPFNNFCLFSVENDKIIFEVKWSGNACSNQFNWDWTAVFDPYASGSGAGCIAGHGCFIASHRNWEGGTMQTSGGPVPLHWMSNKENEVVLRTGWTAMEVSPIQFRCASTPGCGLAIAGVTSSGSATCPGGSGYSSCMQTVVDGDPYDQYAGSSLRVLGTYQLGDYAMLDSGPNGSGNRITPELVLVQISGTTLTWGCPSTCPSPNTVLTVVNNYPGSVTQWYDNGFGLPSTLFWNYAADPKGANSSGNTIIANYSGTGVHGWSANSRFSYGTTNPTFQPFCNIWNGYCYSTENFTGKSDAVMATALTNTSANQQSGLAAFFSSFAGKIGFDPHVVGNGNIQTHPNLSPMQIGGIGNTGLDARPFLGIPSWPSSVTAVSGCANVYVINTLSAGTLLPKTFDIFGYAGSHVLTHVGGPGAAISCGTPGAYTICYAYVGGDCHSGSAAGDTYVNVPYLVTSWGGCYFAGNGFASGVSNPWFANDICIGDRGPELNAYVRYDINTMDISGRNLDFLGYGFSGPRPDQFMSIFTASTGSTNQYPSWYLIACQPMCGGDTHAMTMAYKAPEHYAGSVDHTTYVPINVNAPLPSGATRVGVKFWYTEYGNHCTLNYADDCIATASALTVNDPGNYNTSTTQTYWFQSGDSGNAGFVGSTGGNIQVPGLGGHVMHYAVVGYSGTPGPGTLVYTGPERVVVVP